MLRRCLCLVIASSFAFSVGADVRPQRQCFFRLPLAHAIAPSLTNQALSLPFSSSRFLGRQKSGQSLRVQRELAASLTLAFTQANGAPSAQTEEELVFLAAAALAVAFSVFYEIANLLVRAQRVRRNSDEVVALADFCRKRGQPVRDPAVISERLLWGTRSLSWRFRFYLAFQERYYFLVREGFHADGRVHFSVGSMLTDTEAIERILQVARENGGVRVTIDTHALQQRLPIIELYARAEENSSWRKQIPEVATLNDASRFLGSLLALHLADLREGGGAFEDGRVWKFLPPILEHFGWHVRLTWDSNRVREETPPQPPDPSFGPHNGDRKTAEPTIPTPKKPRRKREPHSPRSPGDSDLPPAAIDIPRRLLAAA